MELTYKKQSCTDLQESDIGKTAMLAGWASTIRDLGGIIFVELRDKTGLFQLVADPTINPEVHKILSKIKPEYVIQVEGEITKRPDDTINDKLKTGRIEMYPKKVTVLSTAQTLPFVLDDDNVSEDVRLKYRYLDLRREKMMSNFRLRHKIVAAIRNYLNDLDFMEVETPILIKATPEGAPCSFKNS